MKAINISMQDYNTGILSPDAVVAKEIVESGKYALIIIDDVGHGRRKDAPRPAWFTNLPQNQLYLTFHDSEADGEGCLDKQTAQFLADEILHYKEMGYDIIVSCIAGISRSGAVVQAAIDLGYEDTGRFRTPNNRIKNMIKDCLGIGISAETSAFNTME